MPSSTSDHLYQRGLEAREKLLGPKGAELLGDLVERNEAMSQWVVRNLFGEVYADDTLDLRTRSLCTVAMVIPLSRDASLKHHFAAALRIGVSHKELQALVAQSMWYAGMPAAVAATKVLQQAHREHTGQTPNAPSE